MTAPALWTQHRPLARKLARDWHLPGADRQDVEQEALIALWEAARTHDPARSNFPTWARTVIGRHLADCLRTATRGKQMVLTVAARDDTLSVLISSDAPDHRDAVRSLVASARDLSQPERAALTRIIDGAPLEGKADDNLRYRVRRKLRVALAADPSLGEAPPPIKEKARSAA